MPTMKPRISVTLNPSDAECMQLICSKNHISMSSLVRKVIEDWLEDYEDLLLAKHAEEAEQKWIEDGCKTIPIEELCQELDIQLNSVENLEKNLFDFQKTSKKESSKRSTKDSRILPKMENR